MTGNDPASEAWEAPALPLSYIRISGEQAIRKPCFAAHFVFKTNPEPLRFTLHGEVVGLSPTLSSMPDTINRTHLKLSAKNAHLIVFSDNHVTGSANI